MTDGEIQIFKQFAQANFAQNTNQYGSLSATCTWVKMPFVDGVSDAYFLNEDKNPVQSLIKRNIQKFSDDAVWLTDLGKVVAVDIFNGNNDRFDIFSGRSG